MDIIGFFKDYTETKELKKKLKRLLSSGVDYNFLLKMILLSGQLDRWVDITLKNGEKITIYKPDQIKVEKQYVNNLWEPMLKVQND